MSMRAGEPDVVRRRSLVKAFAGSVLGAGTLAACGGGDDSLSPSDAGGAAPQPDQTPLVVGRIVSSVPGMPGDYAFQMEAGLAEAHRDLNAAPRRLSREVELLPSIVHAIPGQDLSAEIAELKERGATAVVVAVNDEDFIAMMPALVEAELAIVSPTSSAAAVRTETSAAGLLTRTGPTNAAIAQRYIQESLSTQPNGQGAGRIALVAPDSLEMQELATLLSDGLGLVGGQLVVSQLYPGQQLADVGALAQQIVDAQPSLAVLHGGRDMGALAAEIKQLTDARDDNVSIPVRFGVRATRDYEQDRFAPQALSQASGYSPSAKPSMAHENQMLNHDTAMDEIGYQFTGAAYDALCLIALASHASGESSGAAISRAIPQVLSGHEECTEIDACASIVNQQREAAESSGIRYRGRAGQLALSEDGDAAEVDIHTASWADDGSLVWGESSTTLKTP